MSIIFNAIIPKKNYKCGDDRIMKIRKKEYGNCNLIGKNTEKFRKQKGISQKSFIAKMQIWGVDINPTSYSKLEGQIRIATDKEVFAISKILGISLEELFND